MANKLIVLSGEAGAGKDSIAKILAEAHGWRTFSLAAPLKRFAEDLLGFSKEQLYGPSHARNAPDPRWNLKCPACGGTGNTKIHYPDPVNDYSLTTCKRCESKGRIEISPRSFLQPLGSEFLRDMIHPDILSMRAVADLEDLIVHRGFSVVINDARYQNDRDNLHAWLGAKRIDVLGVPNKHKDPVGWRLHQSELSRPKSSDIEHTVLNDEEWPFPSLAGKVETMLEALWP